MIMPGRGNGLAVLPSGLWSDLKVVTSIGKGELSLDGVIARFIEVREEQFQNAEADRNAARTGGEVKQEEPDEAQNYNVKRQRKRPIKDKEAAAPAPGADVNVVAKAKTEEPEEDEATKRRKEKKRKEAAALAKMQSNYGFLGGND